MSPASAPTASSTSSTGKLFVVLSQLLCRIYRYQVEDIFCWTQVLSGTLQTALYIDFLYYYYISVKEGKPVKYDLPM